ncbi:MAG: MarR family winged helix-turn-helix transcriptional regulator [Streptococcus hyointestinalis]|uniref:MarR family transcriptional regulator n=1 Tax=Streptococcus hyointestinalis TaxID=1337 RepID=A0A380KGV3_9STRE|nr:MarR family winged helix-turn-helix transcriptional regulator [Streptococcus hyointestinalis]MCI6872352.1 MarR family winged helix-turn-helix transcriptional regulator [Streptococcus hyointestinalis]MDD6383791.1 MarR family winged helix-turn-helix transcriptional regulator [Streptococcus hyointestinalis]MDD7356600.1 MarR family winged helix-turn-helix transcriptional regulator [Streptococcus hyointestinalis]MDY4553616.1 MarR family winged helix-turn-helix transcriptional regulator [Streptoco
MFTTIRTIGAITRTIQMDSNRYFKEMGLNNNLFIYIIRICETPGLFLNELADSIQIDRTTSFRAVQKLVKQGYLTLEKDAHNQKIKRIYPTQKSLDIYPKLHAYEQQQSDKLLSHLTDDEKEALELLLTKLTY